MLLPFIKKIQSLAALTEDDCSSAGFSTVSPETINIALRWLQTANKIVQKNITGTITTDDSEFIIAEFWNCDKKLTICFGEDDPTYIMKSTNTENGKLLEDNDIIYCFSWLMKE